jgi:hypothetical protein
MVLVLSACDSKNDNNVSGLPSFDEENKSVAAAAAQKKALPAPCSLVSVADAQVVVAQPMAVMSSDAEAVCLPKCRASRQFYHFDDKSER